MSKQAKGTPTQTEQSTPETPESREAGVSVIAQALGNLSPADLRDALGPEADGLDLKSEEPAPGEVDTEEVTDSAEVVDEPDDASQEEEDSPKEGEGDDEGVEEDTATPIPLHTFKRMEERAKSAERELRALRAAAESEEGGNKELKKAQDKIRGLERQLAKAEWKSELTSRQADARELLVEAGAHNPARTLAFLDLEAEGLDRDGIQSQVEALMDTDAYLFGKGATAAPAAGGVYGSPGRTASPSSGVNTGGWIADTLRQKVR